MGQLKERFEERIRIFQLTEEKIKHYQLLLIKLHSSNFFCFLATLQPDLGY